MWQKYKNMFNGTSPRITMVKLTVISFIVTFVAIMLDSALGFQFGMGPLYITTLMVIAVITIPFQVRRLRDGGLNWKHIFWAFCPIVGPFIGVYQIYFRASRLEV